MKAYKLIFLTKEGAELQTKEVTAKNKKEAIKIAKQVFANSMLNDLHKIEVKPSQKLLKVTFENYYSRVQSIYTLGTVNQNKAIAAIKKDQYPRQFKYISCELVMESELTGYDWNYLFEI